MVISPSDASFPSPAPLRFGILGTGNIAAQFARGVASAQRSVVTAVGSRTVDSANAFGQRFGLSPDRCHRHYDALLIDPTVDAVYLSLPNHLHHEWTCRALEAGRHVLCEKPLAMNPAEGRAMFDAASRAERVLMEAFMYRCHPLMDAVRGAIDDGRIGQLRMIRAQFCYRTSRIDGNIRFDPAIGGGALMDIGCYCLDFCRFITRRAPVAAHLVGNRHPTGVDDYATAILKFDAAPALADAHPHLADPITASLSFGMTVQLDNTAHLGGTDGHLQIPVPWKPPQHGATYVLAGQTPPKQDLAAGKSAPPTPQTVTVDAPAPIYGLEADRFADAVAGRRDLPMTPRESQDLAALIDQLKGQV